VGQLAGITIEVGDHRLGPIWQVQKLVTDCLDEAISALP
jgi:hypothetical protein